MLRKLLFILWVKVVLFLFQRMVKRQQLVGLQIINTKHQCGFMMCEWSMAAG